MLEFQNRQIQLPDGAPVIVSRILGSIDGSTVMPFEDKLLGFLDQGVTHLILVFSQVDYINSTGMGILVKVADKFQEVGGDICLINVPDKLVALFNMLGLLSLIKLYKSESEALERFQKQRTSSDLPSSNALANMQAKPPLIETPPTKHREPHRDSIKSKKPASPKPMRSDSNPSTATAKKPATPAPKRPVVIRCKQCMSKISLGTRPRAGTYKCPRCMAVFKLFKTGKIKYL